MGVISDTIITIYHQSTTFIPNMGWMGCKSLPPVTT